MKAAYPGRKGVAAAVRKGPHRRAQAFGAQAMMTGASGPRGWARHFPRGKGLDETPFRVRLPSA